MTPKPHEYLDDRSEDAVRLLSDWQDRSRVPKFKKPRAADWKTQDWAEHGSAIVWSHSDREFAWAQGLHEVVGKAFGARRDGGWTYQWPAYEKIYRQFFLGQGTRSVFNAVVVLPSRVALHVRSAGRKHALVEIPIHADPVVYQNPQTLSLGGLCTTVEVPLQDLVWTRRDPGLRLDVLRTEYHRTFGEKHIRGRKIFQADPYEDLEALLAGRIPALHDVWRRQAGNVRTSKPLVHLWRLDTLGMVDILAIETDGPEGLLVSMRWARESLGTVLLPHPFQAKAISEALCHGKELFL